MDESFEPVAVLGATGQLGSDLVRVAEQRGLDVVGLSHDDVEVTDVESVRAALDDLDPGTVVNPAAYHAVDEAETSPTRAFEVNATGALHVTRVADQLGARVVYVSTDYVFAGNKPAPKTGDTDPEHAYVEDDPRRPVNVYGASKAAGEDLTRQAADDPLVVRTSSLFGVGGESGSGNFVDTILGLAEERDELSIVDDQWMTPTYTRQAARVLLELARDGHGGTVHVTSPEACTWYDLGKRAIEATGHDVDVDPCPAHEYPTEAGRPRNSALDVSRLAEVWGEMDPWPEQLGDYLSARENLDQDSDPLV